jgi:putative tryptophan/tyrosine transport system substrate-binding protein
MITRRRLVISVSAAGFASSFGAFAQQRRVHRLGLLVGNAVYRNAFLDAMRGLGYAEGKNLALEVRDPRGNVELLPRMAAELVERNVDLILASNTLSVQAAKRVAGSTPIVFAAVGDPVASGFVETLAKPGRSITGVTVVSPQLASKRLQIFKEAFPLTSRMGALASDSTTAQVKAVERAAKALGITLVFESYERADQLRDVEDRLKRSRLDSLYILEAQTNLVNRTLIADLALRAKLPTLAATRELVEAGALISYGVDYAACYRQSAVYVDKILKGARPADLPVEQASKYDLVVNAKTAKGLGVTIPRELLLRADKVIE